MMHEVCARAMSRGPTICELLRVGEEEEGEGGEREEEGEGGEREEENVLMVRRVSIVY